MLATLVEEMGTKATIPAFDRVFLKPSFVAFVESIKGQKPIADKE